MNNTMPRAITPALLSNVQALIQNKQITLEEKNEITNLIRKGLTDGYEQLIQKLEYLSQVIEMDFLAKEMLDIISGSNQTKEDILC